MSSGDTDDKDYVDTGKRGRGPRGNDNNPGMYKVYVECVVLATRGLYHSNCKNISILFTPLHSKHGLFTSFSHKIVIAYFFVKIP